MTTLPETQRPSRQTRKCSASSPPHSPDTEFSFTDADDDYPEAWLEVAAGGNTRLKAYYRPARAREVRVEPTGLVGSGMRAWFLPGKFRFCPRCGLTQRGAGKDRTRLASLSAEGRSSATTVLVGSALRWMHGESSGMDETKRKLLGFTDNRQDAALQAGHFNDFFFVSLFRAGFLGALEAAGDEGLRSEDLGLEQQKALGFDRPDPLLRTEWLQEPGLRGFHLQDAEKTLRQVLAYRAWFDQRRGWRYTNPNLEQLGLVEVDYLGLDDLAADSELYAEAPDVLRDASPETRAALLAELLDHMRKWMAIHSHVLDATVIEQMVSKAHSRLKPPWGFGDDERPRQARWLLITSPARKNIKLRDEDLILRGGSRSSLGKTLKSSYSPNRTARFPQGRRLWTDTAAVRALKGKGMDALIGALLAAASVHGLVTEEVTPFDDQVGWKLNDACVVFRRAQHTDEGDDARENAFFRDFYANLASALREAAHPAVLLRGARTHRPGRRRAP